MRAQGEAAGCRNGDSSASPPSSRYRSLRHGCTPVTRSNTSWRCDPRISTTTCTTPTNTPISFHVTRRPTQACDLTWRGSRQPVTGSMTRRSAWPSSGRPSISRPTRRSWSLEDLGPTFSATGSAGPTCSLSRWALLCGALPGCSSCTVCAGSTPAVRPPVWPCWRLVCFTCGLLPVHHAADGACQLHVRGGPLSAALAPDPPAAPSRVVGPVGSGGRPYGLGAGAELALPAGDRGRRIGGALVCLEVWLEFQSGRGEPIEGSG